MRAHLLALTARSAGCSPGAVALLGAAERGDQVQPERGVVESRRGAWWRGPTSSAASLRHLLGAAATAPTDFLNLEQD